MGALDQRLNRLVGPKTAGALDKAFDLQTVRELLLHYPRRIADRGSLTNLGELEIGEHVTVMAKVADIKISRFHPKPADAKRKGPPIRTEVSVTDGTGHLILTFFRQPWVQRTAQVGMTGLFAGRVNVFNGQRQLLHPNLKMLDSSGDVDGLDEYLRWRLIPIYPASAAISSWDIAKAVRTVLDLAAAEPDPLPIEIRAEQGLMEWSRAIELIHRPETMDDWAAARRRLRFDEAFVTQTVLAQRRGFARQRGAVPRPVIGGGLLERFDGQLPFTLTSGQREIGANVAASLAEPHPMQRLLQGEVGSGKTVVALRGMLQVVDAGGQTALLAPTEVLARQHFRSLTTLLGPLAEAGMLGSGDVATRVALLTGSQATSARRATLLDVQSGAAGIVVGTHALLEEKVQFADLGLVVVDEQHRFGVEQRARLTDKSLTAPPHVLVMTATPIPRTVAMTVFGDLDVWTLRELPAGRADVTSTVVPVAEHRAWLDRAWVRIREEVEKGHQAYVVCPRIGDEPETAPDADTLLPTTAVVELAARLRDGALAGLRVEMLHGRMSGEAKDDVMQRFSAGAVDVLVSTTVIEVGVDVANASVMVIMDAERFGVSQLHQLRGRIGRGSAPGLCLLVTAVPAGSSSRERLEQVAATRDGFALSQLDLEYRREGDVLGAIQAGRKSSLRLLSVVSDEAVIVEAREHAEAIVDSDPELSGYPGLAAAVAELVRSEAADFLERS